MNVKPTTPLVPATFALFAAASIAHAQAIIDLGTLPGGATTSVHAISTDGTTAVGDSAYLAFRWTEAGGIESLGKLLGAAGSLARGVNTDGTAVCGFNSSTAGQRAIRWTVAEGNRNLGSSGGGVQADARGINGDGSVVVGFTTSGGTHAYRWTLATGMVSLGVLPGGTSSIAQGVSSDGTVVVGQSGSSSGTRAFRWTSATGMTSLGVLPGFASSTALGVSADGSTVFGYSGSSPFRHRAAEGMITVAVPDGATSAQANSSTADGAVLILDVAHPTNGQRPYRWAPPADPVDFATYLTSNGVDLTGWVIRTAYLSGDGTSIAGTGEHDGLARSYIIRGIGCDNAPVVTTQPFNTAACAQGSGAAIFNVAVSGTPPYTFHWRKNGTPIDTAVNPSAATATLSLTATTAADAGRYDCIIADSAGCRSVTSNAGQLFFDPSDIGGQGGVPGMDGLYDNNDFVVFIDSFFNQSPTADLGSQGGLLGSDGLFDNNDFIVFIDVFFTGCS